MGEVTEMDYLDSKYDQGTRLKKHESPKSERKRNSKGKLSSARLRQLKKSRNQLRKRLESDK